MWQQQGGPSSGQSRPPQGFAARPYPGAGPPSWAGAGPQQQAGIPGITAPGQPSRPPAWGGQPMPGGPRGPYPGAPGGISGQPRNPMQGQYPQLARKDGFPPGIQQGYGLPPAPGLAGARPVAPGQVPALSGQQQMLQQAQAQAHARAQAAMAGQPAAGFPRPTGAAGLPGVPGVSQPTRPTAGGQAASLAPQTAATGALAPLKAGWTEHNAPDGRKYYYNAATKVSSWTRPVETASQGTPGSQGTPQAQGTPIAASTPLATPLSHATPTAEAKPEPKQEIQCDWKEFTAPDGRKYYYNRITKESKWQMPDELKKANELAAQLKAQKAAPAEVQVVKMESPATQNLQQLHNGFTTATNSVRADTAKLEPVVEPKKTFVYATKEEAKDAFKELLASVGTSSRSSWESTMRLIINDPRYAAFKSVGEKKACFNEYLQQRANEEKEEKRRKEKQTQEDFLTLLELSPELKLGMRYSKAESLFSEEPRWQAIKEPRERETLFNEHMKERERKEKEEKRQEIRKRKAAFKALLDDNRSIKVDTPWRKAQARLEGEEEYESLDKFERLEVYQDHIRDLEKREKELKEKEKEDRRRQERKHRDMFKDLLRLHLEQGLITPRMRWKEYYPHVEEEDVLKAVEKNLQGSRPKELFEDVLEELEDNYLRDRAAMRAATVLEITSETNLEDFLAALDASMEESIRDIPYAFRKSFFEEEVGKAQEKQAKEQRRRLRKRDEFTLLLEEKRGLKYDTTWPEAEPLLEKEPEYKALDEADRKELFDAFIEKLQAKVEKEMEREREKEERRKSKDEDKPKKDKKRHKKERHRSSDKKAKEKSSSKRRQSDSEHEEERKSSKRSKKDKEDVVNGEPALELPGPPEPVKETAKPPRSANKRRSASSDDEEGQL